MGGCILGQVLHGSATTTEAIRRAIQRSQESLRTLAKRHGINPKTVAKWKKRSFVADLPTGPKQPSSTVLSIEEEAIVVAFRRHTLLPLDDCLYALQPTIPHLTRSSLHRCLKRHGISRLPQVENESAEKRKFKTYPIGYFHIDIAEVRTAEGKLYLFVAIDRTSKFAFVELHDKADRPTAVRFLEALIAAVPYRLHTVLTDNAIQFADLPKNRDGWTARYRVHRFDQICRANGYRTPPDQTQPPLDQWSGRAHEPYPQGSDGQSLSLRQSRAAPSAFGRLRDGLQLRSASQDPQRAFAL